MKKNFIITLLLVFGQVAFSSVCAEEVTPYQGSRIFWDMQTRTTVFYNGGYGRVLQLQDGRLMAVCEGDGINVSFSSNKGTSWTSAGKIATTVNNVPNCVPDLIQLKDGTIIVAYNPRPNKPYTEDRKFGIRCKRSTDNGRTWSDEISVYNASYLWDDGCWEPSMLELPSGELQLYFANEGPYTTNDDQNISLCRSFDGGQTWGSAETVSYRQGARDGMPCPVLLKDKSEIVVSIEDNGWPGVGTFFPTTVRCPIETNWHGYFVDAASPDRAKTLDFDYCPNATGGAPYLRVLPSGETVLSYQSDYGHNGKLTMYVAMGNEEARDFKSLQHPFRVGANETVLWNSVSVIDTGIVLAVGGVNNNTEIIKGYPVSMLQAPYNHPAVDGKLTKGEGYYRPLCNQVIMGVETGIRTLADFAYDDDSLYFIGRMSDRTSALSTASSPDGIFLLLDMENVSGSAPLGGMHKIFFRRDTTCETWHGDDAARKWVKDRLDGIKVRVTDMSTYYITEAAIPWSALGLSSAPVDKSLRASVEMQDYNPSNGALSKETIPDGKADCSWTWMPLRLQMKATDVHAPALATSFHLYAHNGMLAVDSATPIRRMDAYTLDGRKLCAFTPMGCTFSTHISMKGALIVRCVLDNDDVRVKKVIL